MARTVRALTDGFINGRRIRAGEVFTLPDHLKIGKWMEEINLSVKGAAPAEEEKEPTTFSELNKSGSKAGPKDKAVAKALASKTPAKAEEGDALV
jgi:hypothetical protein